MFGWRWRGDTPVCGVCDRRYGYVIHDGRPYCFPCASKAGVPTEAQNVEVMPMGEARAEHPEWGIGQNIDVNG